MTARMLAVKALMRQEQSGYASLVLDAELKRQSPPLEPRDAAFAASIFYTALEHQSLLDYLIDKYSKKPAARLDAEVRAVLRAGLAQARYMNVPLPAAVNEAVKLTKKLGKTSAAGMVNAILRRAAAHQVKETDFADPLVRLEVYYSLSPQIARLLYAQYGEEALAMAKAFEARSPLAIRVNTLRTSDEGLIKALEGEGCTVQHGALPHSLLLQCTGSPAKTAAFAQGLFHVQGLASQYAALCTGAAQDDRVLDLCAAPGGKSQTMAEMMCDKGELISAEGIESRVPLLEKTFARCGTGCARAIYNDATVFNPQLGKFDRVLCDVPCSGLGVIGKKPDIRYKSLENIEELYTLQQKILQNGAGYLAQNGRLVYSTCTVNYYENQAQIEQFLAANKEFAVVTPEIIPACTTVCDTGVLFLPYKSGTDGFFVSILQRKG